jgi:hypothetical protein
MRYWAVPAALNAPAKRTGDLMGVSGLAIVDAILSGERVLRKLAQLRDPRVRASEETII